MREIRVTVNDREYVVQVEDNTTLLELLRDKLGVTSPKRGCNTGDCGACTVLMDGKAVLSCLVLAVQANGKRIMTVEGLGDERELHPIQKAFIDNHAFQCGFCTPGMIMAAKALLDENPNPDEDYIKEMLVGNLCRCGCHPNIISAIMEASKKLQNR